MYIDTFSFGARQEVAQCTIERAGTRVENIDWFPWI